jgi:hypothetical protein
MNPLRKLLAVSIVILTACAYQPTKPPPPPAHPVMEGNVNSVHSSDVRRVIELAKREIINTNGLPLPIYSVRVNDHNHIDIHYWTRDGFPITLSAQRVRAQWKLVPTERIITTGVNIPTR